MYTSQTAALHTSSTCVSVLINIVLETSKQKQQSLYHCVTQTDENEAEILRQKVFQGNSIPSNDKAVYFMSPEGFP